MVHRKLVRIIDTGGQSPSRVWWGQEEAALLARAVSVRRDHVAPALSDSPAVLAGSMEPVFSLHRAPTGGVEATKRKHFLHVFKHVIEQSTSKRKLLEMMPLSARTILVCLEVIFKMLLGLSVLVLTKKPKVFEEVIKIEVKWLLERASTTSWSLTISKSTVSQRVVLFSPVGVWECFICWKEWNYFSDCRQSKLRMSKPLQVIQRASLEDFIL